MELQQGPKKQRSLATRHTCSGKPRMCSSSGQWSAKLQELQSAEDARLSVSSPLPPRPLLETWNQSPTLTSFLEWKYKPGGCATTAYRKWKVILILQIEGIYLEFLKLCIFFCLFAIVCAHTCRHIHRGQGTSLSLIFSLCLIPSRQGLSLCLAPR